MIARWLTLVLLTCLAGFAISCATTDGYNAPSTPTPTPVPTPKPKPPEPLKPEFAQCRVSNGAGRIFTGTDQDHDIALMRAKRKCAIYYRNCVLLGCTVTLDPNE